MGAISAYLRLQVLGPPGPDIMQRLPSSPFVLPSLALFASFAHLSQLDSVRGLSLSVSPFGVCPFLPHLRSNASRPLVPLPLLNPAHRDILSTRAIIVPLARRRTMPAPEGTTAHPGRAPTTLAPLGDTPPPVSQYVPMARFCPTFVVIFFLGIMHLLTFNGAQTHRLVPTALAARTSPRPLKRDVLRVLP